MASQDINVKDSNMNDLNEESVYLVGAFSYLSKEASEKALKEQNKIMKLEGQMDYNNPKVIYSVYCKVIEKGILETLEGVNYLVHLQNYLYENESFLPGPIPSIPADILLKAGIVATSENNGQNVEANADISAEQIEELNKKHKDEIEDLNYELDKVTNKNKLLIQENKRLRKNKDNPIIYKIVIGFLIVIIIAMLFIAMRSDSPNIINYKNKIQNEYADWEQQLREKEKELNDREKSLQNYD